MDSCLLGIVFLAPLFLGGRHDLGRLIFVALASVAGVAWFAHQSLSQARKWTHSWAFPLGLAALLLVLLQLLPLSQDWLITLSPRTPELLPLWSHGADASAQLGTWATLSLAPSSTSVALATLIAYLLLFATVIGRLRNKADIEKLIRMIGYAGVLMGCFGLIQYYFSNDRFFWFYEHPHTTTSDAVKGSFTTRNHFAHFLTLAIGPLLACCLLIRLKPSSRSRSSASPPSRAARSRTQMSLMLCFGIVVITLGVLLSLSRGGAAAFATAVTFAVGAYYRRGLINGAALYGLAMLGVIVVGVLSFSGYEEVSKRLDDFVSGSVEGLDKNEGRRKIWAANLEAIQAGTFFGAGAGSHREIYHLYLPQSLTREYTHAENGYLQIATENGWAGALLLAATLVAVGSWCMRALLWSSSDHAYLLAVGITASLLASVIHAFVDFVWFIPSCMSLTIILAACALRLGQLETQAHSARRFSVTWPRSRWICLTATAAAAAGWAILTTLGPATAATHRDKYLLAAKVNREHAFRTLTSNAQPEETAAGQANTESAIFHLRNTLAHDPRSARAHLRLAGKYLQYFNLLQQSAANSMSVDQIREAALASRFQSGRELQQWLQTAFGQNSRLLYQAHYHTVQALRLCPLQGEGYLYLANLCFLEGNQPGAVEAYIEQSLLVRPYHGRVLFEAGRQLLLAGQLERAFNLWKRTYHDSGIHQLRIVRLLAGELPAPAFLQLFQPNWHTLRYVWQGYEQTGRADDMLAVLSYAENAAEREFTGVQSEQAAYVWRYLSNIQSKLNKESGALHSMEQAYRAAPSTLWVRRSLGQKLLQAARYDDAAVHLRWCLARQPDNDNLRQELVMATKHRLPSAAQQATATTFR